MNKFMMSLLLLFFFSACTWVNENKGGRSIGISTLNDVSPCQKVGDISVGVKHKVGIINRGKSKVLKELQILARNEAVKLGANQIVPNADPVEGKQNYQAFICP
jgi:hypothetical protein